jgi:phage repressor protein C with HTH and peptisase S24 domain
MINSETKADLASRIRKCADLVGSGDALAQKAAIPRRTLETYLAGKAEPKAGRIAAIAKAAGVNLEWLATGEGPMRREDVEQAKALAEQEKDLWQFELVPRYEVEAAAGGGRVVERESEIGRLAFRKDWIRQKGWQPKDLVVIRIIGDSMEPTIKDGALALVNTAEEMPAADGIYVLSIDGHLVAKRLQLDLAGGGIYIRSDNPAYETQHLSSREVDDLFIVGRVVWAGQEV